MKRILLVAVFVLMTTLGLKADCRMDGQFAVCEPPYKAGEFLFLPNSWPSVYEILSPGYGIPQKVSGFAGDVVVMAPWTVFRASVGYAAGKVVFVLDDRGFFSSHADGTPAPNMTTYVPPGSPEPVDADPRALEFMNKRIQEILDAR